MSSILLINDNSSHNNWGAQATAFAAKKLFRDSFPEHELKCIPWEWLRSNFRQWKLPGVKRLFDMSRLRRGGTPVRLLTRPREFFPSIADDYAYWAQQWMTGGGGPFADDFVKWAGEADAVVHNAENSIYFNMLEGCRSLYLLWFAKTVLKTPAFSINQTAHLTGVWAIMDAMVGKSYPTLDGVTARELKSLENLHRLGISNAQYVPDVVFYLRPSDYDAEPTREWIRSHGLTRGGYFCLSTSGLPASIPKAGWDGPLVELVRNLKNRGLQAVLVAKDNHCRFLADVARRTDAVFFGPEHQYQDLWPLFENAAFVVTGHVHYASFAVMVGCPFVPLLTNNHKMAGLCQSLDWKIRSPHNLTFLERCGPEILDQAEMLCRDRPALSHFLCQTAERWQREASNNAKIVEEVISGSGELAPEDEH